MEKDLDQDVRIACVELVTRIDPKDENIFKRIISQLTKGLFLFMFVFSNSFMFICFFLLSVL